MTVPIQRLAVLLFVYSLAFSASYGQEAPLFETRAVWFATVLGDGNWPESSSDSPTKQANDLRDRIRAAKAMGLNTFIMQVVARGDAMYQSERLPWSARLGGAGVDPGYDPLQVAIDEAHLQGMELHAWFNVFRIGDISTVSQFEGQTDPGHVYYNDGDWVQNKDGRLWLDPAIADARAWLVDHVMEIVENYDIDGIHFDFARYDLSGYSTDLDLFTQDPRGFTSIHDWRRNNVTLFIRDASTAVMAEKNWVKVGIAPLGNYTPFTNAWPALWAFDDTYQESRLWMTEGSVDYLAPQIYFSIGREPAPGNNFDSPDFSFLVDEWVSETQGKPIFVGTGPYKPEVFSELNAQIASARTNGGRGQVFFRYDHILPFDFETSYPTQAIPWPMSHRFLSFKPEAPSQLLLSAGTDINGDPQYTLNWPVPFANAQDPIGFYSIFRSTGRDPDIEAASDLVALVHARENEFIDTSVAPGVEYRYQVTALSRLGKMSDPSPVETTPIAGIGDEPSILDVVAVRSIYPNPAADRVTIGYQAPVSKELRIQVFDLSGREVFDRTIRSGSIEDRLDIEVGDLSAGVYLIRLTADTRSDAQIFVVQR